jgi:hypothetical protein
MIFPECRVSSYLIYTTSYDKNLYKSLRTRSILPVFFSRTPSLTTAKCSNTRWRLGENHGQLSQSSHITLDTRAEHRKIGPRTATLCSLCKPEVPLRPGILNPVLYLFLFSRLPHSRYGSFFLLFKGRTYPGIARLGPSSLPVRSNREKSCSSLFAWGPRKWRRIWRHLPSWSSLVCLVSRNTNQSGTPITDCTSSMNRAKLKEGNVLITAYFMISLSGSIVAQAIGLPSRS